MGHLVIPRNVIATMSKMNMWVMFKKNPKYWFMVTMSLVAAPSCAISTGIQKLTSYQTLYDRANVRLMKDEASFEKFLHG